MKLSSFNPLADTLGITAGEAITRQDLVLLHGLAGKGYKSRTSDYAAVGAVTYGTPQTSAATGMIVAQTQVCSSNPAANYRQAMVRDAASGDIFTLSGVTASGGLLSRFSAGGSLLGTVTVDGNSTVLTNFQLLQMSNGNLAAFYAQGIGSLYYAVYDASLNVVKASTLVASTNSAFANAAVLSGGGFAVVYHDQADPLTSKLVTFDNAGTAVLAATTIWTRTGTSGNQYHRIAQLSNGNLAITINSANTISSIGLHHGIFTIAGASVLAFANLNTSSNDYLTNEISVFAGFYCVTSSGMTATIKSWVFDNTGIIQGAAFSVASTAAKFRLLNDGIAFWIVAATSSDSKEILVKIPTTGTGYITTNITTSTPQYNHYLDAFYEKGHIVGVSSAGPGNTLMQMWVVSTTTGTLVNSSGTNFGVLPGIAGGTSPRVVSGGDGAFICMYDYVNTASVNLCIGKWVNTAVLGPAAADALISTVARIKTGAGPYVINAIAGTAVKSFDHTANTVKGNKGTIMPVGCTLGGF